jgi:hypothetical protein
MKSQEGGLCAKGSTTAIKNMQTAFGSFPSRTWYELSICTLSKRVEIPEIMQDVGYDNSKVTAERTRCNEKCATW